ncbi:MAG TPA: carboxypeptidase-like regulatory domain-containing protein [Pyrinomonadaceae bacterium]|nr:carboxypeptidase-like regulatory domain-containing protein [Pyrinomonadaceae bacterium]
MIKFHRTAGALLILLFAFCVCAQTSEPATATVDTKTGVITGRVVNENGEPHVNASVLVRPDTPEGLPVTQATTNRDGVFKLSGLERGSYTVSAAVPAHTPKSPETRPVYKDEDVVTLVLLKGGVITGTVTGVKGEPVVGIGIRVRVVRDESGRSYGDSGRYYDNMTDDRGVYRVYGLPSGTYVVSADGGAADRFSARMSVNGFANDLPTYAPSSSREDASGISVRTGEEISNVNIRYRAERGSTISGILRGLPDDNRGFSVRLMSLVEGGRWWDNQFQGAAGEFAFDGIPDGDYALEGMAYWSDRTRRKSESIVLHVRGADIEGLDLTVLPLASINGRVVLEPLSVPAPDCSDKRQPQFSEVSVTAWHRVTEGARKKPQFVWRASGATTPNAQGILKISEVAAGEYYFAVRFSAQQWFLQSIALAPQATNVKPADVTRAWTTIKPGDRLSTLTFTLAQGAALVRGEVSLAEGQKLPEKLVAYLVPAEQGRAEEVLRYFAAPVNSEGRFWLNNVAPGRYWILAQPGTDDTRYEVSKVRLPDGAETRSSLRHIAEKTKTEIELKPCQELTFRLSL